MGLLRNWRQLEEIATYNELDTPEGSWAITHKSSNIFLMEKSKRDGNANFSQTH